MSHDELSPAQMRVVADCGSYEVRIPGRPSQYFYWDDVPSRRFSPDTLDRETALEKAKSVARTFQLRMVKPTKNGPGGCAEAI